MSAGRGQVAAALGEERQREAAVDGDEGEPGEQADEQRGAELGQQHRVAPGRGEEGRAGGAVAELGGDR